MLSLSLRHCVVPGPGPASSQDRHEGVFGMHVPPNPQQKIPVSIPATWVPQRQAAVTALLLQPQLPSTCHRGCNRSPWEEEEGGGELLPSQKNMSQTRRTELQGSVREKAHMNHSVM